MLLKRRHFEPIARSISRPPAPELAYFLKPRMFEFLITCIRSLVSPMRSDYSQHLLNAKTERQTGDPTHVVLALISLIAIVACVGVAVALVQIRSLRSEVAGLHREFAPLKERIAQLDQTERARRQTEERQIAKGEPSIGRAAHSGDTQAALALSDEEAQLVREYIKPAPSTGASASAVKVGDVVDGAMLPLPSPITEKVPKLLGARFTIRNGAIIIVRKDSRQADAILTAH